VSNLPLYVFRVRPTNTFHLSIQKQMARGKPDRFIPQSGFSFGGKHRESDIHSMIGTHTRARSFALLPRIWRVLDSPSRISQCVSNAVRHCCFCQPAHYSRFRFDRWIPLCLRYSVKTAKGFAVFLKRYIKVHPMSFHKETVCIADKNDKLT